jgi:PST family polysaccharide transporter
MNSAARFEKLTCTKAIRSDLRGSSIRAAAFTWSAGVAEFILRLGSTAILARLILPEYFGLVMMVTAVTAVADQFRDLGLSTATVQQKDITHKEITNLFWINVLAGLTIAFVICAVSPAVAIYYRDQRLIAVTCVLATNFVWGGLMVQHQALLARVLKLGHSASVRVLASALSTGLAILLAWRGFGYWALVWREVARCALLTLGMWICFPWIPGLPCRQTTVRNFVRFGAHLSAANILGAASGGADRFLIGRFWGAAPVAMYRQAYQLLVMPMEQLIGPVYQVAQPGLSMLQADVPRYRQFYRKVLTVACLATMPLSAFVAVHSSEITRVLLGKRWSDSGPILMILSFATFILQPIGSSAFVLITRGRSKVYLNLTLLQIACGITAMCVGAHWGTIGVAMSSVVVTYVLMVPRLYYGLKGSPVTVGFFFSVIAKPALASIAMAAVLFGLKMSLSNVKPLVSLIVGCIAAGVSFPAAWILMPGGKQELLELVSDLRAALKRKTAKVTAVAAAEPVEAVN